jgi:hypothetical protein
MRAFANSLREIIDPRDERDLHWRFNFADGEIKAIASVGIGDLYLPIHNVEELRCGPIEVIPHPPAWRDPVDIDWRSVEADRRARRIDAALRGCMAQTRLVLWRAYGAKVDLALAQLGGAQRVSYEAGVLAVQPALCNLVELAPVAEQLRARSGTPKPLRQWLERQSAKVGARRGESTVVAALLSGARAVLESAARDYAEARRKT